MRLDQAAIQLRAREPWEAVDLGAVMLRAWWRPLYATMLMTVLPITVVLHLALTDWPWLALLLTWWLKPLYDRVVLHVIAEAVFDAPPPLLLTLARLRQLLGSTGLGAALTWQRLDSARAFNLSVHQLEGQRGPDARARRLVLGRRVGGQASGVLYACLLFELLAMISLSGLVDLVTPATLESEHGIQTFFRTLWGADASPWGVILNHSLYVLAVCAIEPLYVAGSFALYLNRRTLLEAWDLELSFRRMAERHARRNRAAGTVAMIACVLAIGGLSGPHNAHAGEQPAGEVIREILAAPEFQEFRSEKVWQRRAKDDRTKSTWDLQGLASLFEFVSDVLAGTLRFAAYTFLAVGAYFFVRYIARNFDRWSLMRTQPDRGNPPRVLFGLDVRPEALPDDLAQVAAAAADSDPRLSLSLLYRGALATLIHRDRIDFAAGDTEADCVQRIDRTKPAPLSAYFLRLVEAWSRAAYAQRMPDRQTIQTLCDEWPQHFSVRGETG